MDICTSKTSVPVTDGEPPPDTRRTLRLARPKMLNESLAIALDFEAVKETSRGHAEVRALTKRDDRTDDKLEQLANQIAELLLKGKKLSSGRWNCGEMIA